MTDNKPIVEVEDIKVEGIKVEETETETKIEETEEVIDISDIDHAEMVRTLAKPGYVIAAELAPYDISILTIIGELCRESGIVLKIIQDSISNPISADEAHLWHMAIGMVGESAELLDAVKKFAIYRKEADGDNIVEELGDFEFYLTGYKQISPDISTIFDYRLSQLYEAFEITREEVLEANIRKLAKRYNGLKYSDQAAQDRADKA